jgi:predicted transposase YdaD
VTGQEKSPDQPALTAKELWARARPDLDSGRCETWAEYTALSEDERVAYDRMLKRLWDYPSVLRETRRENLEEGEKIGEKKGEKIGRKKERLENARALLMNGVSEEIVCKSLKLTDEELAEARIKQ